MAQLKSCKSGIFFFVRQAFMRTRTAKCASVLRHLPLHKLLRENTAVALYLHLVPPGREGVEVEGGGIFLLEYQPALTVIQIAGEMLARFRELEVELVAGRIRINREAIALLFRNAFGLDDWIWIVQVLGHKVHRDTETGIEFLGKQSGKAINIEAMFLSFKHMHFVVHPAVGEALIDVIRAVHVGQHQRGDAQEILFVGCAVVERYGLVGRAVDEADGSLVVVADNVGVEYAAPLGHQSGDVGRVRQVLGEAGSVYPAEVAVTVDAQKAFIFVGFFRSFIIIHPYAVHRGDGAGRVADDKNAVGVNPVGIAVALEEPHGGTHILCGHVGGANEVGLRDAVHGQQPVVDGGHHIAVMAERLSVGHHVAPRAVARDEGAAEDRDYQRTVGHGVAKGMVKVEVQRVGVIGTHRCRAAVLHFGLNGDLIENGRQKPLSVLCPQHHAATQDETYQKDNFFAHR